jgi:hypothetical protein
MDQPASTLAFDTASQPAPRPAPLAAPPAAREIDHRVDEAETEHAGSMVAALGLCLVGGGILASYGHIPSALGALAVLCFAAGIVLQHLSHRKLRAALIERAVAKGASGREARAEAEAALDRRLG